MCGIIYLTMQDVAKKLNRKSVEFAIRWCFDHNLTTMTVAGRTVVVEYEFRAEYEKPLIAALKKKHGDRWIEYYAAYDSEDITRLFTMDERSRPAQAVVSEFDLNTFFKKIKYE